MRNIKFDEGYESFSINGDKNRTIRFNPADPEMVNRLLKMQEEFSSHAVPEGIELNPDGTPRGDLEKGAAYIGEFSRQMRRALNDVFNADVYDALFNGQSPLCVVGAKGAEVYLFEAVVDALKEIIEPSIDEYSRKNRARMEKYLPEADPQ